LKKNRTADTKELILILCTFAFTGIFTGWLSKKITGWADAPEYGLSWWSLKFVVLIFGYKDIILLAGFCFGMFSFSGNMKKEQPTTDN